MNPKQVIAVQSMFVDTPLGHMLAIADESVLYLLEFMTRKGLDREISNLYRRGFVMVPGVSLLLQSLESELKAYFSGKLTEFKTPFRVFGTSFQQQVWQTLCTISYGTTKSYAEQATIIGKPRAYRAVAKANGANQLAIIIPCHRIIASDGSLGGYGGGLAVKEWLLAHERVVLRA